MLEDKKNTRVLLMYPPTGRFLREDRCQIPERSVLMSPLLPPMDLLSLAAVAESAGCTCRVEDFTLPGRTSDEFHGIISQFAPHYLLLTITTPTLNADLAYCEDAKRALPGLTIIARGAHFLRYAEDTLERYHSLDMVIRGEAEATLQEIVKGRNRSEILGLSWRSPDGIVNNEDRPFIENLDALPLPARHLIDNEPYVRPDTGDRQGVIKVSRGCPYHCFYCLATPVAGTKVRARSPEHIVGEIKECVTRYGIHDFIFWSDCFTHDRRWVMDLCGRLEESRLQINWSANARAGTVDAELAGAMKRAGCWLVSIGVENGDQTILDRIGKRITIRQVHETVAILKGAGLKTLAYYLIGLPWDTHETVERTMGLSIELNSDYASFFVATPFPGTLYYDYAVQYELLNAVDDNGVNAFENAYFSAAAEGHYLSRKDIAEYRRLAEKRYFVRVGYIMKRLMNIRSLRELINHIRAARSLFSNTSKSC